MGTLWMLGMRFEYTDFLTLLQIILYRYNCETHQVQMSHADSFLQTYDNMARKKESRLTRISLSIVWLFIICHVWKLIPTIYELIYSEVFTEFCTLCSVYK